MQNVRIFFEKAGLAKYISHLDLMRCFSRAIRRADIDIWYTEGFNPHPFMTFSIPLSLGTESYCESVDIRLNSEISFDDLKLKLDNALPTDIKITKVCEPVHKADEICFAEYDIIFTLNNPDKAAELIENAINADEIPVEKKSKQGRKKVFKQVDIKKNIKSYSISVLNDSVLLNTVLTAGSNDNINPSLLINAVIKNINGTVECIDIIKKKIYISDMTEFN